MALRRKGLAALLGLLALACQSGGVPASRKPRSVAVGGSAAEAIEPTAGFPTPASAGAALPPASAAAEAAPDAAEYSIIWGTFATQSERVSFLLEWRSPELKVLGKRSGAVITSAGGIYRFRQTTGKGTGFKNCDEAWEGVSEPDPKNHFAVTTQGAKMQRLDAPDDVEVAALPDVGGVTTYSNGVELQASLGSYLFIDEWEDSVYCTANHGLDSSSSRVFDVVQRVSVEFPTKADEFVLREEAQQSNRRALEVCRQAVRDAHSGEPPSGATPELADLSLRRVTPTWTSAKGLRFQLDFGVLSTYVVGEKTCTLTVSHAPPSLERFKLPSAFAALSRKLPGLTVSGWSLLEPADATALAAAQRVFGKR